MRLVGAEIRGYRRLVDADVRLDEPLIAVVGPNEAGKSSLLGALARLEDDQPFAPAELSRGKTFPQDHVVIRVWFGVDDDDRAALPDPGSLPPSAVLLLEKHVDGSRHARLQPAPLRDYKRRVTTTLALYDLADGLTGDPSNPTALATDARTVGALIDTELPDLTVDELDQAAALLQNLEDMERKPSAKARGLLGALIEEERKPNPHSVALSALSPRRPTFLTFGPEERDLRSAYDLNQPLNEAFRLFAKLGNLNLEALLHAQAAGDEPPIQTLTQDAASVLERELNATWTQSELEFGLRVNRPWLHIMVRDRAGQYVDVRDRSEGLRFFLSLLAFVRSRDLAVPPILLVDEADAHLHYDAQADLVDLFQSQVLAGSVIYTTHSPGCLPDDIGAAIRAVRQTDRDRSVIDNNIWRRAAGLTPILLAIGASTAAFTPARRVVISEGASDAILLPTVLRQATGLRALGYQVAPGLSVVAARDIPELELEAAKVAYLVDGDAGGDELVLKLKAAKIAQRRILSLGDIGRNVTVEDLVTLDAYVQAANMELAVWGKGHRLTNADVPGPNRSQVFEAWCAGNKISAPYKPAVAARLVELGRIAPIVEPDLVKPLRVLHQKLAAALGLKKPAPRGSKAPTPRKKQPSS